MGKPTDFDEIRGTLINHFTVFYKITSNHNPDPLIFKEENLSDILFKANKTTPKVVQVLLSCTPKIIYEKSFYPFINADYNGTIYTGTKPKATTRQIAATCSAA